MNETIAINRAGFTLYVEKGTDTIVDIDVLPDTEKVVFGGSPQYPRVAKVKLRSVMKQFPGVKELYIRNGIWEIEISNFMFPNIERVRTLNNSNFLDDSPYLINRTRTILNAFRGKAGVALDTSGIYGIGNYALEGCLYSVPKTTQGKYYPCTDHSFSGYGIEPLGPSGGVFCFDNNLIRVEEGAEEITIPKDTFSFRREIDLSGLKVNVVDSKIVNLLLNYIRAKSQPLKEVCLRIPEGLPLFKAAEWLSSGLPDTFRITVEDNPYVTSIDGILYSKDRSALLCCPSEMEGKITVPEGVRKICSYAFSNCKISGISLPDSLREIEHDAFYPCYFLKEIDFGNGVREIGRRAFRHCNLLERIKLPASLRKIKDSAFCECENLNLVEMPEGLEEIGFSAFDEDPKLKELDLPASVTDLDFDSLLGVEKIRIHGDSVPSGLIRAVTHEGLNLQEEIRTIDCSLSDGTRFFIPYDMKEKKAGKLEQQISMFGNLDNSLDFLYEFAASTTAKQVCALKAYLYSGREEIGNYLRRSSKNAVDALVTCRKEEDLIAFLESGLATGSIAKDLLKKAQKENMTSLTAYILEKGGMSKKSFRL